MSQLSDFVQASLLPEPVLDTWPRVAERPANRMKIRLFWRVIIFHTHTHIYRVKVICEGATKHEVRESSAIREIAVYEPGLTVNRRSIIEFILLASINYGAKGLRTNFLSAGYIIKRFAFSIVHLQARVIYS